MKKHNSKKKWKLLVIFIWIAFLIAVSIGCINLQKSNVYKKARTELQNQEEIISRQFSSLVDTDFDSRAVLQDRMISEVKAISFVLENYDDIDQAKEFLEDIVNKTEIKNLCIYDRNGNIVFVSGAAPENTMEPDDISYLLDSRAYELVESTFDGTDRYWTTTYLLEDDKDGLFWGVKDQWLIYAENTFSDTMKDVVQFFDWEHALQDISVGRDGFVLAVSEINGSILSYPDSSVEGKPVEDLNIRIAGEKDAATAERLLEEFSQTGEIKEIEVGSVRYYATRMNIDFDMFLVMFPAEAIEEEVYFETVFMMLPLALITGIGILYMFCLAGNDPKRSKNGSEKKAEPIMPVARLKLYTIIAVLLIFILSLYLETHLVYARMFQYTSTTAEDVMQKKNDSDKMLKELQTWMQKGILEKCRIAECGILHASAGKPDRQYVSDLADCLNVSFLYVFDKQGKVSFTNAPYDGYIIDENSPFHALLEGAESVVLQPDQEEASGEVQQEAGVTMIDESNRVAGAVVIADSTFSSIPDNLSFDTVFQRVFLKDNTVVMAINSENMTVQYFAQVDGSLLVSDQLAYDYSQIDAAALGLNESLIRDHYNGEMFAVNNQYFASIRRNDNAFLLVLRPLVFIDTGNLLSVIYLTVCTLLFFILMIFVTGKFKKDPEEDSVVVADQAKPAVEDIDKDKDEDDVLTLLGNLANRKKPYFEERWPSDGIKWRDKTPMEKFSAAVKLICIAVLALIVVYVVVEGENSVLYYCFHGEWSSGINLYSITSCIISIILLVLLKEIIHKVLYLIARAAQSRGETICHLLNSFSGYILFFAGIFIILNTFGVNLGTLSLTAGVAGVIFGIGCQNTVADILAGIIMTFEGVAHAGDFISYNGQYYVIQSIGVRSTKLKWYCEVTIVRNNEFKNYINLPSDEIDRVVVYLRIDLRESFTRVESIITEELPQIRERLYEKLGDEDIKLTFRGLQSIEDSGIKLSFTVLCKGMYFGRIKRLLNRELWLLCERHNIRLAMPQVVINEPAEIHKDPGVEGEVLCRMEKEAEMK